MKEKVTEFLGQVIFNFRRSEIAYENYKNDESKFIYAKILKNCNEKIYTLLIENSFMLSEDLIKDALKLISHYEIWLERWEELEQTLRPSLNEKFIFDSNFTFPKDAAQNFINEFNDLKKNL